MFLFKSSAGKKKNLFSGAPEGLEDPEAPIGQLTKILDLEKGNICVSKVSITPEKCRPAYHHIAGNTAFSLE